MDLKVDLNALGWGGVGGIGMGFPPGQVVLFAFGRGYGHNFFGSLSHPGSNTCKNEVRSK